MSLFGARWTMMLSMAAIAAVVALPLAPNAAASEPTFRALSSTDRLVFGETKELEFKLEITGGDEAKRFTVDVGPSWNFGQDDGRPEGTPIGLLRFPVLAGDAVEEGGRTMTGLPGCSPNGNRFHGEEPRGDRINLYLPAGGRATLTASFAVGTTAPWPTTDYRAAFTIEPYEGRPEDELVRPDSGTVAKREVLPPPLTVSGRRGVRIFLTTSPESSLHPAQTDEKQLDGSSPVSVSGLTDPPIDGDTIRLAYRGPDTDGELRTLARVDVAGGRFRYEDWRPQAPGRYELWAFYDSSRSDLASDYFCPRAFTLTAPVRLASPNAAVRLASRRALVKTGRVATVLLRCLPSRPQTTCSGRLSLRAKLAGRRRVIATQEVTVPSAKATQVRLRLSRRAWRQLRRQRCLQSSVVVMQRQGAPDNALGSLRICRGSSHSP